MSPFPKENRSLIRKAVSSTPEPVQPEASGAECRIWERHGCDVEAACQPIASRSNHDLMWTAKIRDISVGGIGFTVDRRFEKGTTLFIECQIEGAESSGPFMARVVHATPQSRGSWIIGCAFIKQLTAEEVEDLLRSAEQQVHRQPKRLAEIERLTGRLIDEKQPAGSRKPASDTVLLAEVTLEAATAAGKTARVLARRFCVSGLWPLAENSILQLSIPAVGRKALSTEVRVLGSIHKDGRWTMQYAFMEEPSAELLSVFGHSETQE